MNKEVDEMIGLIVVLLIIGLIVTLMVGPIVLMLGPIVLIIGSVVMLPLLIYALYWFVKACKSVHKIGFLIEDIKKLKEKEYEFKKG